MPSPFPGMNPYLERPRFWRGIHVMLLGSMNRALVAQVGEDYSVNVEEDVYVHEPTAEQRRLAGRADVAVQQKRPEKPAADGGAAVLAPAYTTLPQEVSLETDRWLEIRDADGERVVTVIELLSPSNKVRHRESYLRKRRRLMTSGDANFVEIDLLRLAGRMPLDGLPPCDYCLAVARPEERPRIGVWPLMLRDPLPVLPIPLRPPDADVFLDLPALLDDAYDGGGLARTCYRHPPDPPLPEADRAWAEALVPV